VEDFSFNFFSSIILRTSQGHSTEQTMLRHSVRQTPLRRPLLLLGTSTSNSTLLPSPPAPTPVPRKSPAHHYQPSYFAASIPAPSPPSQSPKDHTPPSERSINLGQSIPPYPPYPPYPPFPLAMLTKLSNPNPKIPPPNPPPNPAPTTHPLAQHNLESVPEHTPTLTHGARTGSVRGGAMDRAGGVGKITGEESPPGDPQ